MGSVISVDPRSAADIEAAANDDVLQNRLLLDATFRGDYAPDTLECANRLAAVSGGTIQILDEDLEIMREAALYNDYLGVNNYQCRFLKAYDGENDLHHNGTGEKGTGRWRVKGIGEHVNKPGIPTTDWDWIIYPEGLFDLLVGGGVRIGRLLDHLAANADQVAAQGQVIDDAGVVGGVGRRGRAVHQVGEVAQPAELVEGRVLLETFHQDGRLGQQTLTDVILDRLEQPLMEGFVHVRAAQAVGQPLEHGVVEHQRAQQRLLGFQIVRHRTDAAGFHGRGREGHGLAQAR